ncbi:MAG TPA: catalase family protein [Pseudomonadota bacterium]|nr:catalase family protein [Pseudomonadota bacterium]
MTPSKDWKEQVAAGEEARFEGYAKFLAERQKQRAGAASGSLDRGLHAKGHIGARAELTVLPNLPGHAQVGLFAQPRTFSALVRFSNGQGKRQADGRPDVRGMAVKVLGVPGKKVIPGLEDAQTQDLLMIQSAAISFKNSDEFMFFVGAAGSPATLLPKLVWRFGLRRTLSILGQIKNGIAKPVVSLATMPFYSALPVQFGPYAVKYAVFPAQTAASGEVAGKTTDYLSDDLKDRLAKGSLTFDLAVQFFCDEASTPIEDASVLWSEEKSPYVKVARLHLPQQDLRAGAGLQLQQRVESLSFDPWHALVEHRPLGEIMRARNVAYRVSTQTRQAAPEPTGDEK